MGAKIPFRGALHTRSEMTKSVSLKDGQENHWLGHKSGILWRKTAGVRDRAAWFDVICECHQDKDSCRV